MGHIKKVIIIIGLLLLGANVNAQIDRSQLPEPGPAPEIKIEKPYSFTLENGLRVFVVENNKLPQVTFSLILDRDPIFEGEKAGYVSLAGQMLRRGTTSRTKEELDEEIDFLGATISTSATSVYASGLSKYTDKLVGLMTDIILNPTFPVEELDKIRKQRISEVQASKDDPEGILSDVRRVLLYGKDHPYGELVTEESLNKVTLEDVKTYYQNYFKPNIAYLAVVGDIKADQAETLIKSNLSDWKKEAVPSQSFQEPSRPESTVVALVDRPQAVQTNLSLANTIKLLPGDPDVIKSRVMNLILGGGSSGKLFQNLREDKGYTYGAYSSIDSDEWVSSFSAGASVRNEVTDSAVAEFVNELNAIQEKLVDQEDLELAKNTITGSFARSLEDPSTVARFAINQARYNLPDNYYNQYLKKVSAVTREDVREMAEKYINIDRGYIVAVGKKDDIMDDMDRFGEVRSYDIYGNLEKEFDAETAGVTASEVLDKYIQAIGGKSALGAVESIAMKAEITVQGRKLKMTQVKAVPERYFTVTQMGPMELSKSIYNQGKGVLYMQGQRKDLEGNPLSDLKIESHPFVEKDYPELGVESELAGIKNVNGEEAYKIKHTYPSGTIITEYFSVDSGLKLKREGEQTMEYENYQEVKGVMIPYTLIIGSPMGKLTAEIESVEINEEVDEKLFEIE